ncbi:10477_t:CDS:1, partial [Racocetra persica]
MSITLACLVRGEPITKAFAVDIKPDKLVSHLKEIIKLELHPQFINIPAKDIKLWKIEFRDDDF